MPRFLLYCHNVHGLGHIVRTLRIANALARHEHCQVKLITGCQYLDMLEIPAGLEVTRLPALRVNQRGRLSSVDGRPVGETLQDRMRLISTEVAHWDPDVVLVDHNPLGLLGECTQALDSGGRARFVWGVRDIWGSASYLEKYRQLGEGPNAAASRIGLFHSALAYTDPHWIDTFEDYAIFRLPERRYSTGFITGDPGALAEDELSHESGQAGHDGRAPLLVTLSGGGCDALALNALVLDAVKPMLDRGQLRLRIVVGPMSSAASLRDHIGDRSAVEVLANGSAEHSIRDADVVVSRVGYNTAYSILRSTRPLIFVPILKEDSEQQLRADRLARLQGIEKINESSDNATAELAAAIDRSIEMGRVARQLPFSIDGAHRAAECLVEIAAAPDT